MVLCSRLSRLRSNIDWAGIYSSWQIGLDGKDCQWQTGAASSTSRYLIFSSKDLDVTMVIRSWELTHEAVKLVS